MIKVEIDEIEVRRMYLEKLKEKMEEVESELVFWDSKELMRRTCMCWNTIQDKFFFDPRFPKFKVGGKWYFPTKETREFLIEWLYEQPRY
ncbi:group-specific protein [Brevibacillus laterosporus]|uniref:group-specific protein n=1 Tax=Brevibacillus laterosporus TaxID=1465 RepID=UPI000EB001F4|nr:group-specific protein [Brevibacillus laterosporus]AYK08902.1 group-specific protein [Brevibacillus laterosporus]